MRVFKFGEPPGEGLPAKKLSTGQIFSPRPALRFALSVGRLLGVLRGCFALCGAQRERILQNRTFILRCAAKPLRFTPQVCLRKHRLCRTFLRFEEHEGLRTPRPARPFEKGRRKLFLRCPVIFSSSACRTFSIFSYSPSRRQSLI